VREDLAWLRERYRERGERAPFDLLDCDLTERNAFPRPNKPSIAGRDQSPVWLGSIRTPAAPYGVRWRIGPARRCGLIGNKPNSASRIASRRTVPDRTHVLQPVEGPGLKVYIDDFLGTDLSATPAAGGTGRSSQHGVFAKRPSIEWPSQQKCEFGQRGQERPGAASCCQGYSSFVASNIGVGKG